MSITGPRRGGLLAQNSIRDSQTRDGQIPDEDVRANGGDKDFRSQSISYEHCDSTIHVFVFVCVLCVCVQRVYVHERVIMYSRSAP